MALATEVTKRNFIKNSVHVFYDCLKSQQKVSISIKNNNPSSYEHKKSIFSITTKATKMTVKQFKASENHYCPVTNSTENLKIDYRIAQIKSLESDTIGQIIAENRRANIDDCTGWDNCGVKTDNLFEWKHCGLLKKIQKDFKGHAIK